MIGIDRPARIFAVELGIMRFDRRHHEGVDAAIGNHHIRHRARGEAAHRRRTERLFQGGDIDRAGIMPDLTRIAEGDGVMQRGMIAAWMVTAVVVQGDGRAEVRSRGGRGRGG